MSFFAPEIEIRSTGVIVKNAVIPIIDKYEPYYGYFRDRKLPYNGQDRRLGLWQYWQCYFKGIQFMRDNPKWQRSVAAIKVRIPAVKANRQKIFSSEGAYSMIRPFVWMISNEVTLRRMYKPKPLPISCGINTSILVEPIPMIAWTYEDQASFLVTVDPTMSMINQAASFEIIFSGIPIPMCKRNKLPTIERNEYRKCLEEAYQMASFTI